jgi:hypothetical protein
MPARPVTVFSIPAEQRRQRCSGNQLKTDFQMSGYPNRKELIES